MRWQHNQSLARKCHCLDFEEILLSNCINRSLQCKCYKERMPKIVFLVQIILGFLANVWKVANKQDR